MEVLWIQKEEKFPDYSLVLPAVSVGNIGQLAIDVMIASLDVEKVAVIHHPALLQICGYDAFLDEAKSLTSTAELYVCREHKLLLLQIRAPYAKGKRSEMVGWLSSFSRELVGEGRRVVLAGLSAAGRHDVQMTEDPFRFYGECKKGKEFPHPALELVPSVDEAPRHYWNGSGITKCLVKDSGIEAALLYLDEGNNGEHAARFAVAVLEWLTDTACDAVKFPPSWKFLFGVETPQALYG